MRLETILVFPVAAGIYVYAVLDPFADGEGGVQPALVQCREQCVTSLRLGAYKAAGQMTSTSHPPAHPLLHKSH